MKCTKLLLLSCCTLLLVSCNSSLDRDSNHAPGNAKTDTATESVTNEKAGGGETVSPTPDPGAEVWVPLAARWEKKEGESYNGWYDSVLFYFKRCGNDNPEPAPREQVELLEISNCDTDSGPPLALMKKGDDDFPPTLVAIDDISDNKAIVVRNGITDSISLSPAAIKRVRSVPLETIRNHKKMMMKKRQRE
jgi:hypothetical protein